MSFEFNCHCEISPGYCFELGECNCNICTICFSKAHAARGCKSYMSCPSCEKLSTKWQAFKVIECEQSMRKGKLNHSSVRHQRIVFHKEENAQVIEHEIEQPNLVGDPKQFNRNLYHKKGENYDSETLIVSVTGVKNGKLGTLATQFGSDGIVAGETNLIEIFRLLHKPLVTPSDEGDDDLNAFVDPSIPLDMQERNSSLLHRCIHALATQSKLYEEPNDSTSFRAQRASTFAATDIIRFCKCRKRIGKLQKFISKYLSAFGAHQGLWKVLNRFNLSISLDKNRRIAIKDVNSGLQGGLKGLDLHAIFLFLYDNLGFRVKKGYDQYTMIQWILITKQQLRNMNLYPPVNKSMDDIAFEDGEYANKTFAELRLPEHVWENICEETSFETILGLSEDDYKEVGESVYRSVQVVLQHYNHFPKYEEARNILSSSKKQRWKKNYSCEQDAEASVALNDHFETLSTSFEEKEEEEVQPTYDSNYHANNAQIDMPIHSDLNQKVTCGSLLDYALEVEKSYSTLQPEEGWEDITPLYKDVPMYLLGDGNPTYLMSSVIREQNDQYKDKVRPYTGGFHFGLEGHRKRGQIFGPSLLEDTFFCWRESEGQLKWVMNPGDPNQINAELVMYELAMNAAAVHSLIQIHGSRGDDTIEITPKMVVDHILKRAKEWPIVMVALIEMRFANLIFMLNESEIQSNDKLFRTVKKCFLRLFASTHCTKYVSMMTDFFVHWHCCSPAEKILFAKAIFTRKTKNNKSVFVDRFVELMMRDFRMWLGKHGTAHTSTLLERCAMTLVGRKQTRAAARRTYTGGESEIPFKTDYDDIEIDVIFCEAFVHAIDCNYFGEGPPRHIKPGPCCKRKYSNIEEFSRGEEGFSTVGDSKQVLNKEILKVFSIGEDRARRYFYVFASKPDFYSNSHRSEKEDNPGGNIGVSLQAIHPLKVDAQKNMKIKITGATSVKYEEIRKAYHKPELVAVLHVLFNDYKERFDEQIAEDIFGPQSTDNKDDLINKLIILRKLMMKEDERWKGQENAEAKRKYEEDEETTDISTIISRELENPFYSLEHGSKTVNIDKKFVFDSPSDGQSDDAVQVMYHEGDDSDSFTESFGLGISKFKNTGTNILL